MPESHRPDYVAWRQKKFGKQDNMLSKFQDAYTWPYINPEDLSSQYSLITFINSRALNSPYAFVLADLEAARLGMLDRRVPEQAFLEGRTLILDGDTVDTYGRLVASKPDKYSPFQLCPGRGLRALELQKGIYQFLVKCCELILRNCLGRKTLFESEIPPNVLAELLITSNSAPPEFARILPSLDIITAEAPYRFSNLDLKHLREIFATILSEQEDYLYDLRENPAFFFRSFVDCSEHRRENLLFTDGTEHPLGPSNRLFGYTVLQDLIINAYINYENGSMFIVYFAAAANWRKDIRPRYYMASDFLRNIFRVSKSSTICNIRCYL